MDLATNEGDARFHQIRSRLFTQFNEALAERVAQERPVGDDIDPRATAGAMTSMLAHVADHRYGFESYGIRTADFRESMGRILFTTVTGRQPLPGLSDWRRRAPRPHRGGVKRRTVALLGAAAVGVAVLATAGVGGPVGGGRPGDPRHRPVGPQRGHGQVRGADRYRLRRSPGPVGVRLGRAAGGAGRRLRPAHGRAGGRRARQPQGGDDEARPDGQLPRPGPALARAHRPRRAPPGRPAHERRAGRRVCWRRSWGRAPTSCSPSGTPCRWRRLRSARSTGPSPTTTGPWRSRSSTRGSTRRSGPTSTTPTPCSGRWASCSRASIPTPSWPS